MVLWRGRNRFVPRLCINGRMKEQIRVSAAWFLHLYRRRRLILADLDNEIPLEIRIWFVLIARRIADDARFADVVVEAVVSVAVHPQIGLVTLNDVFEI